MRALLSYLAILAAVGAFISGCLLVADTMFPAPDAATAEVR